MAEKNTLPNPYPAGPRFLHNTQRKDVNAVNHQAPAPPPALTGQAPDVFFKAVTITPEARRIARILGMRSAEYLAQRLIDAEDGLEEAKKILSGAAASIETLVARVHELEKQASPAHLRKVEKRTA
jgi:hypothetical protein